MKRREFSRTPGPATASAPTQTQTTSFQEQHALSHLEYLLVNQIEDLTVVFTVTDPGG